MYVLFCLLSLSAFAETELKTIDVDKFIDKNQCHKEIKSLLSEWNASSDKWRAILASEGTLLYNKPTNMLSVWIEFQQKDARTQFSRITPGNITNIVFNEKCEKLLDVVATDKVPKAPDNVVDDKKLFSILNKDLTGLVYSWSPHMNLSVKGLKAIQAIAAEQKLPLTVLMDSQSASELELAKKILDKEKIKLDKILIGSSMELYYRRTNIHYPNLIVFKNGRIVDGMLPGLAGHDQYTDFIKAQVK